MLADKLLAKLGADYEEVCLENVEFPNVNEDYLAKRSSLIDDNALDDPMFLIWRTNLQKLVRL